MKAAKAPSNLIEMPYPPQKNAFSFYKCANFTSFFKTPESNNSNLSNEKQIT